MELVLGCSTNTEYPSLAHIHAHLTFSPSSPPFGPNRGFIPASPPLSVFFPPIAVLSLQRGNYASEYCVIILSPLFLCDTLFSPCLYVLLFPMFR